MDSITQIALGASVAAAVGFKPFGRKVLLTGAFLGTLPDLDVFVDYGNAIDNYTSHRGFSHSLFVLSLLSLALYYMVLTLKPHLNDRKIALFLVILLPLITHPLLDSFTTYGTQLLWPLPSAPIALHSIFIIDPLYTLPLLVSILLLWFSKNKQRGISFNKFALTISCLYLAWGQIAQSYISKQVKQELNGSNEQLLVMPTPFNSVFWRVLRYQGQHYQEAFTYIGDKKQLQWTTYQSNRDLVESSQLATLTRLEWFSHGWLRFDNRQGELQVTDLRLGVAGFHPFKFVIAQQVEGSWQAIEPREIAMDPVNSQQLLIEFKNKIGL